MIYELEESPEQPSYFLLDGITPFPIKTPVPFKKMSVYPLTKNPHLENMRINTLYHTNWSIPHLVTPSNVKRSRRTHAPNFRKARCARSVPPNISVSAVQACGSVVVRAKTRDSSVFETISGGCRNRRCNTYVFLVWIYGVFKPAWCQLWTTKCFEIELRKYL